MSVFSSDSSDVFASVKPRYDPANVSVQSPGTV